ncbi:hypothetical protein MesoLjLb_54050 [Mesorhizobium sp. L-8-3]|nr:hypothetical protein MesoLjLb_54050 [Mesorhizobium sp. L-8-3]
MGMLQMTRSNLTFGQIDQGADAQAGAANTIRCYRTAKAELEKDWISDRRYRELGPPEFGNMNAIASIHRAGFRDRQEDGMRSPFLSIATNWRKLLKESDSSTSFLTNDTMVMAEFEIPPHYLFRPKPCAPQSKRETEWLYYDFPEMIGNWLVALYIPPKSHTDNTLVKYTGKNAIPSNVPPHR